MSRLIDADAYSAEMKRRQDTCEEFMHNAELANDSEDTARFTQAFITFVEAKLTLDNMPTIDAVEVVRCRECIWHGNADSKTYCPNVGCQTQDDWFCADGERRDDND